MFASEAFYWKGQITNFQISKSNPWWVCSTFDAVLWIKVCFGSESQNNSHFRGRKSQSKYLDFLLQSVSDGHRNDMHYFLLLFC